MFIKSHLIFFIFTLFLGLNVYGKENIENIKESDEKLDDTIENVTENEEIDNGGIVFQQFETPRLLKDGSQTYKFSFETDGSIKREERGEADSKNGISVIGTYTYLKPDNTLQKVYYTAGTKGFVLIPEKIFLRYRGRQRIPAAALASLAG